MSGDAGRVEQFKELCEQRPPDVLAQLGRLIDLCEHSLRDLYQCTHPETDSLVDVCK